MNPILYPTDFTSDSELAFLIACGIARDRALEMIVLHVVAPERCSEGELDGDQLDRDSALFQSCWSEFERLKAFADGVPMSLQVKVGPSVETIIDVAQRECCSLIVISAHRHCQLDHVLRGSVTDSLAHRTKCPVVSVIPSPFQQEEGSFLERARQKNPAKPGLWPRQFQ